MTTPIDISAFTTGEVSPDLFGQANLARMRSALSTLRNMYVGIRGGIYSRAGTALVGYSKQTGRAYPPRTITFQFSNNQGLALEFGNFYMRVVYNGGFVLEPAVSITGITQANPAVMTTTAYSLSVAYAIYPGVSSSYAPSDNITLAGGTFSVPAVITVESTQLERLYITNRGSALLSNTYLGYAAGDIITLAGGGGFESAQVNVLTSTVITAVVDTASPGTGGTPGTATVTGTTGIGTKFQANVTIGSGGSITSVNSIISGGAYTKNPTVYPAGYYDLVTGAGLSNAYLNVQMGIGTIGILTPGVYTTNPPSGVMTQQYTTGGGVGAIFGSALMAPFSASVTNPGVYSVPPSNNVAQSSTTGTGVGATFACIFGSISEFANGDWIYLSNIGGMTPLNGRTVVLQETSPNVFGLYDVFGNPINSIAYPSYTSGGVAARVYTLATPWAEQDLTWLKTTQSADAMTICCVNQSSGAEHQAYDLIRTTDTNWALVPQPASQAVTPPGSCSGSASSSGSVDYQYCATAVDKKTGAESIASPIATISSAVDIAATAGSISLICGAVLGIGEYDWYKAEPSYGSVPPVGALFGFIGTSYGPQFTDSNIVADFAQVPPLHQNPFARGQVIGLNIETAGSSIATISYAVATSTGSGLVLDLIVLSGALAGYIVQDAGEGYVTTDSIAFTVTGSGAVAPTATLEIGAQSGTYPSVPFYFQERRGYACSLNNPDTYWFSQPGAYSNFDYRIPTIASDAITGSPWSVQVNGIQWALQTAGGLLVMTGLSAWLLVGPGSFATNIQPISPSQQAVTPQAFTGSSSTVPPIKINYDIIYVESKGSFFYDLPYQLYALSEPLDLTKNAPHLFTSYSIVMSAWCEVPFKTMWAVRDDGVLLSLAYYKKEEVAGWARHDTFGTFESCCSVVELPNDALYLATQRTLNGNSAYFIERMDNRDWSAVEDCWCVDCGVRNAMPTPAATLTANSATGLGALTGVTGLVGGAGWSAGTIASVVDNNGQGTGSGATPAITIGAGGVITAITFPSQGVGYENPKIVLYDPIGKGSGFSATCVVNNTATFTASSAVFSGGNVGAVIRMGGGIAQITQYLTPETVEAQILSPIVTTQPNSGAIPAVQPQAAGSWTMTTPSATVSGLWHLVGATVTGLADGNVIPPTVVSPQGQITLPQAASAVTIGLGFTAQAQSVYLDAGEPTVQGQRKKIAGVTARVEASGPFMIGCNQTDGSTLSPTQIAPAWDDLVAAPVPTNLEPFGALAPPLWTGDLLNIPVTGGYGKPAQIAVQQSLPLPLNVLDFVPAVLSGDKPEQAVAPKQQQGRR